ncbi:LysR family transcriptional regulator [Pseudomonas xanthosomatis]|uniref:LysR family transcriptional regulator n=1 Tax=Pseudomonas xanthosomatis TaxID=2842356 RepID=UPI00266BBE4A|nr:LysR family transcriptional regulator [Pseudomonas xanthosomatis]
MPLDNPSRHALPLNALRAFEASARLGGFARAAHELKPLERQYGAALFERHAKGVRLTPLGESIKGQFTEAFDAVEDAARTLRRLAAPQRVCIPSPRRHWRPVFAVSRTWPRRLAQLAKC